MNQQPEETLEGAPSADFAREVVQHLNSSGYTAYWAGGCVRDMLLDLTPKDYDIATSARPDDVLNCFPDAIEVGKSFGVIRVPWKGVYFEVATFRRDHGYRDGRHPESVSFAEPETDAQRRDFTINAMFYDPIDETVHDFVEGRQDLEKQSVRCVGDPQKRFSEDHLRMLRAARLAATLEFDIEENTEAAIRWNSAHINKISMERVREELVRLFLESKRAGQALVLLDRLELLEPLLPEVVAMKGQEQPPEFHPEGDVFTHTAMLLDQMEYRSSRLAFSALLHDIGKPVTATTDQTGRIRFNRHAGVGADMTRVIMRRLRFSNEDIDAVTHCVNNHMRFVDVPKMKTSTLRKFVGSPTFLIEMELHRLDCLSSHGKLDTYNYIRKFQKSLAEEPVLPRPWITGRELLDLGLKEGKALGSWLQAAYDAQLEGRFESRESLLTWLEEEIKTED